MNAAREKYGEKKIEGLAAVLAREIDKKKQAEIRKERGRRDGLPLAQLDKKRFKALKEVNFRRGPDVKFYRRKDGKYDKWKNGRKLATVTSKAKRAYETSRPYWKFVRLTGSTFDISTADARRLIKEVADQSLRKLRKFKKSRKYKSMSARRKRRYGESKTRVNALMRLQFILTGRYDPVGFRLAEGEESEESEGGE